eukprot:557030-Prymnesium_polylepis.1
MRSVCAACAVCLASTRGRPAPQLHGDVGEAAGRRLDRHLPLATAAALGRAYAQRLPRRMLS